ncbi:uncharacterized protein RCC_08697 [Ramularia collo-cygni]|uniref:Uncharacterized protein n=1 Tax=Ramularia collo-cygni TaxID=112498 RepID=A0A2D3VIE0_9PEZI|nr:uncharacterized protein RCC_08697 [Ramularia collo-cygni]CZT22989.1 uncharacterized protein RCC_08697 [Ramularia collo-cygni]
MVNGAVKEDCFAVKDAKDGNYYRAMVEKWNWLLFLEAGGLDDGNTFEKFSAREWKNDMDGIHPDDVEVLWESLMDDLADWIKQGEPHKVVRPSEESPRGN